MIRRLRRLACALLLAGLAVGACAPAYGHATLVKAEPPDGAMLADAPAQFTLTFNEPVAPLVFRLVAPDGSATTPSAEVKDRTVTIRPAGTLIRGSHVLSWRVTSADGHPVGGALQFAVGAKTAAPVHTATGSDRAVAFAIWAARVAIYVGLFIGIGGEFFASWTSVRLPREAEAIIATTLGIALAAVPLSIGFQGADALAVPLASFWRPDVCSAGMQTAYGASALIAAAAFVLALVALLQKQNKTSRLFSAIALAGGAAALAASGHASNATPQLLTRPSVFIHAGTVAMWAGSLLPLFALYRRRSGGISALRTFSRTIPLILIGLAASGVILAVVQLESVDALWSTDYGRVLLVKFSLLTALAALAAFNRFVLTPTLLRGQKRARRSFAASLAAEIACMIAIFAVVGLWRFTPPPRAIASGETSFVHLHGEHAMADISVIPDRAGPVDLRLRLMQEDFQPLAAKEVVVLLAAEGMEPLQRRAILASDGTWRVEGMTLLIAGIWKARIEILINDFKREVLDGPVVITR